MEKAAKEKRAVKEEKAAKEEKAVKEERVAKEVEKKDINHPKVLEKAIKNLQDIKAAKVLKAPKVTSLEVKELLGNKEKR